MHPKTLTTWLPSFVGTNLSGFKVSRLAGINFAILAVYMHSSVFSPAKIEGIGERHILGGASVHIKGFGSTPIPLQRQISTEGIGGPYPLSMLGRTLIIFLSREIFEGTEISP